MYKIPPVAGENYTIVKGDTLWDIASYVYGSGTQYTVIWDANKSNLRSGDPNLIYPGEQLWIPQDTSDEIVVLPQLTVYGKAPTAAPTYEPGKFTLVIDDTEVNIVTGSFMSTFDTPADGWKVEARYQSDSYLRDLFHPYSYKECKIYLGSQYMGLTRLYNTAFAWDASSTKATLEGFSPTADIIDSVSEASFVGRNIKLQDWIKRLVRPFGVSVEWQPTEDKIIKRVKIGKTDSIYAHIKKWTDERGLTVSSTESGGLLIHEVDYDGETVSSFVQSGEGVTLQSGSINFVGRSRFKKTIGYSAKPRKHSSFSYVSPSFQMKRTQAVIVNGTDDGDIEEAVSRAVRQSMNDALAIPIPVNTWYNDNSELYKPGQYVTVQSDKMYLEKETLLLIKAVEFLISGTSRTCVLTVVPPDVYKKGEIIDPWNLVL